MHRPDLLQLAWWLLAACVVYAYAGYPLLVWLMTCRAARKSDAPSSGPTTRSVSLVLAAHNEARSIVRRIDELSSLLAATGSDHELIVVCDGSTDGTAAVARGAGPDV